jgi:hypothetical protein
MDARIEAKAVKKAYTNDLLAKANVVGVGLGHKRIGLTETPEESITVLVRKKVPTFQLSPSDVVPTTVDGWPTDVVEVGDIQAPPPTCPVKPLSIYTDKHRPAVPGISIGHELVTAGTFGCVVYDERSGEPLILSNNHVLSNSNNATINDPIFQPGAYDGGTAKDTIATLKHFIPINLAETGTTCAASKTLLRLLNWLAGLINSKSRFFTYHQASGPNLVDAAIARPLTPDLINAEILHLGRPKGKHCEVPLGTDVEKVGRTTGHTFGTLTQTDATVVVNYGSSRTARFEDQLIISAKAGQFSAGGDSGSLVLDSDKYAVGLLFAGSPHVTIVNPIHHVLSLLEVTIR